MQRSSLKALLATAALAWPGTTTAQTYFPVPENEGGWRVLISGSFPSAAAKQNVVDTVSMDWDVLSEAWQMLQPHGGSFLVIRNGWVAGEWGPQQQYSIASCTKSITSLTMQRLFDLSEQGAFAKTITEDDFAYQYLPPSWNDDPAKQAIKIRHLMTMSSGLEPDDSPVKTPAYRDKILSLPVQDPPDTRWVYASAPVDLLSLVVEDVTGGTLEAFWDSEVAPLMGLGPTFWGDMGSSTVASAYFLMMPRDLARVAYCTLQGGTWDQGSGPYQVFDANRVDEATRRFGQLPSMEFGTPNFFTNDPSSNLRYGKLFWTTNLDTEYIASGLHADAYYMAGYATNFCVVVPEYDLVVVRLGTAPIPWDDQLFVDVVDRVMESVLDVQEHASVRQSGLGCGGNGSTPPLLDATPPFLGDVFTLSFPNLPQGITGLFTGLIYGPPAPTPIPLGSGCSLAIAYPNFFFATLPLGATSISVAVPANGALAGLEVAFQGIVAGNNIGSYLTNGVHVTVGH